MGKLFFLSFMILVGVWVVYRLGEERPEKPHPGIPLNLKPAPRYEIQHRIVKKIHIQISGRMRDECNRIILNSGTCDALPYAQPDWSGYANGIVNRDLL